ncbi:MAG: NUDIX domain-containing protein [Ramlibacter sp.]
MTPLVPDAGWLAGLQAQASQPPLLPREPLWAGTAQIGSAEPGVVHALLPALADVLGPPAHGGGSGWQVVGPLTPALDRVARALRDAGLAGAWRDEQLAVTDGQGRRLGTVERAAVRPLGIATHAVHLAGHSPDGRHWVQRRALDKPNDPGLWDTLMGGMVPAADTLQGALARETHEEAGMALAQLQDLRYGGRVAIRRPCGGGPAGGYTVEHVDWFQCTVPEGVTPVNQDGEVDEFRLMRGQEVLERLHRHEFTLEAALVLCAMGL